MKSPLALLPSQVSFAPVLSPADAEAIRAYVIKRANDSYDQAAADK